MAEFEMNSFHEKLGKVDQLDQPVFAGSEIDKDAIKADLKKSWRDILTKIDQFSAIEQQKIVIAAMSGLDDIEYLEFGLAFLALMKEGKIDYMAGQLFVMPNERKQGFLAMNYQEPGLSEALRGVRNIFHKEPDYLNFIDSIVSGEAKGEYLTFMENCGLKPRLSIKDQIAVVKTDTDKLIQSQHNETKATPSGPPRKTSIILIGSMIAFSLLIAFGTTWFFISKLRK